MARAAAQYTDPVLCWAGPYSDSLGDQGPILTNRWRGRLILDQAPYQSGEFVL